MCMSHVCRPVFFFNSMLICMQPLLKQVWEQTAQSPELESQDIRTRCETTNHRWHLWWSPTPLSVSVFRQRGSYDVVHLCFNFINAMETGSHYKGRFYFGGGNSPHKTVCLFQTRPWKGFSLSEFLHIIKEWIFPVSIFGHPSMTDLIL